MDNVISCFIEVDDLAIGLAGEQTTAMFLKQTTAKCASKWRASRCQAKLSLVRSIYL
jgi:hypothetical protein